MSAMTDIERLIAIEDIKQLKAIRDRALDMRDWETLEACHAPDHQSHNDGYPPWTSARHMIQEIKTALEFLQSVHHSHTPLITLETPTKAKGIWAMEDNLYWTQDGAPHWLRGFGFYHETYEKRDGRWVFTWRRLERLRVEVSQGGVFPPTGR